MFVSYISFRKIQKYNIAENPLVLPDADIVAGKTLPEPLTEGIYTAVIVNMVLHRSTYATMCIREMMRVSIIL